MGSALSQAWPPAPQFTERDVQDQSGKVFIVTGASSGVGKALTQILFGLNAKIYLASRTKAKVESAIAEIQAALPGSAAEMIYLPLDLEDLESVRSAAETFLKSERRLDMLWNNAGVMLPPVGSKSRQGYELQLGVNCLAALLFTRLLTPIMADTARKGVPGAVRVLWVSSSAAELFSPPNGGVDMSNLGFHQGISSEIVKYAVSKAGMVLLSQEYAKRHMKDGIVSVAMNPGNLKSDLGRYLPSLWTVFFQQISWKPEYGAYTELYSAFSSEISLENSGCWVIPWGRVASVRSDIEMAGHSQVEGEPALGEKFWSWCTKELEAYEK